MQNTLAIRHRRTKIVATLGPASSSAAVIGELIDNGVDVFRMNFSHGSHQTHAENIATVRKEAQQRNCHVGILGDLQGPKIRIGAVINDKLALENGQQLTLSVADEAAALAAGKVPVAYKPLATSVVADDILLLDDGRIRFKVIKVNGDDVVCEVVQKGVLTSRKGINRLGGGLAADAITEKDLDDLAFILHNNLDYVAVSFPAHPEDLLPVKEALYAAKSKAKIIAKIERAEVVASDENLQALVDASDGVMVARGDLGVEIGDPQLIAVQKKIIHFARRSNKPVITATQMMESMISEPVPTRAEVFDVANAVLDGTDAVMLSAETATGQYPVNVVKTMSETALGAEVHPTMSQSSYRVDRSFERIDEVIAMSTMYAANHITEISAIVCLTESGTTPLLASRISSTLPIYGISRNIAACRQMALYRGVIPIYADLTESGDEVWKAAITLIAKRGELVKGQRVVVTGGDSQGRGGMTNTLKILQYLDD
jgi:pyruvate kinase